MIKKRLFKKYFPLNSTIIGQINEKDRDVLIHIFRETEREIIAEGFYLVEQVIGIFPFKMIFFSVTRYVEILYGYEKNITSNDIDVMNMILYRNQYKFPISLFLKPLLPFKYITSTNWNLKG